MEMFVLQMQIYILINFAIWTQDTEVFPCCHDFRKKFCFWLILEVEKDCLNMNVSELHVSFFQPIICIEFSIFFTIEANTLFKSSVGISHTNHCVTSFLSWLN